VVGSPTLTWELIRFLPAIPDLNVAGIDSRLDDLTDQTTVHGITVALDYDQAARVHARPHPLRTLKASIRQWPQEIHFLGQAGSAPAVELGKQLAQERAIFINICEVPIAAQQQSLLQ